MNVTVTVTLLDPYNHKLAELEKNIDLPFIPQKGMTLNGIHPNADGYSLRISNVCWQHKEGRLYVDAGEVCINPLRTISAEIDYWLYDGWTLPDGIITIDDRILDKV